MTRLNVAAEGGVVERGGAVCVSGVDVCPIGHQERDHLPEKPLQLS